MGQSVWVPAEDLESFAEMWTKPGYWLSQLPNGALLPMQTVEGHDYAVLIDEDDDLARTVVERMRDAGVPIRETGTDT